MTADDFRKLYYAEPFQPFQVELTDGRQFLVAEPGHLTISPTNKRITIAARIEDLEIVEIDTVAGVRFSSPTSTLANVAT